MPWSNRYIKVHFFTVALFLGDILVLNRGYRLLYPLSSWTIIPCNGTSNNFQETILIWDFHVLKSNSWLAFNEKWKDILFSCFTFLVFLKWNSLRLNICSLKHRLLCCYFIALCCDYKLFQCPYSSQALPNTVNKRLNA